MKYHNHCHNSPRDNGKHKFLLRLRRYEESSRNKVLFLFFHWHPYNQNCFFRRCRPLARSSDSIFKPLPATSQSKASKVIEVTIRWLLEFCYAIESCLYFGLRVKYMFITQSPKLFEESKSAIQQT